MPAYRVPLTENDAGAIAPAVEPAADADQYHYHYEAESVVIAAQDDLPTLVDHDHAAELPESEASGYATPEPSGEAATEPEPSGGE